MSFECARAGLFYPAALETPESVQDAICRAITMELTPHVMGELLWVAQGLVRPAASELLTAWMEHACGLTHWLQDVPLR